MTFVQLRSCWVRQARLIHSSPQQRDLVAPPDPISHIRPIIYDDAPSPTPPALLRHPYSLSEFDTNAHNRLGNYELQFNLQRHQLDAFHHNFWFDSNTRHEAAKNAVLASLPAAANSLDKERALSEFYKQWVMQEKARTDSYTSEWRKRNWAVILLDARVKYHKVAIFIADFFFHKRGP